MRTAHSSDARRGGRGTLWYPAEVTLELFHSNVEAAGILKKLTRCMFANVAIDNRLREMILFLANYKS